ncbi:hypothetical protein [Reyranella sp.]|uniref:hypothetical protein n=1 Tax=Reyranella sp. TaxID=1929291 RepID=UPI003C7B34B5
MFAATCEGKVDLGEVNAMIDAMVGANALRYRKIFDACRASTDMGEQEFLSIGARMRMLHVERNDYGPLAVVLSEDKCTQMSRVLGILAAAKRPMRVFSDVDKARKWLDSPAIRGNLPPAQDPEMIAWRSQDWR